MCLIQNDLDERGRSQYSSWYQYDDLVKNHIFEYTLLIEHAFVRELL